MPVINRHLYDFSECDDDRSDFVNIMRPSKWGNPYILRDRQSDSERAQVIAAYAAYLTREIRGGRISLKDLAALDGKNLVCVCSPKLCHGHVLERIASWASKTINGKF